MKSKLPKRKPTRLKGYDYGAPGAYFVTICVKDRKELLSQIVGDGVHDVPKNVLTSYGKIAEKQINQMNEFYDYITVDKYIVMPNHIHLLLSITNVEYNPGCGTSRTPSPTSATVASFVSTFKRFCNKEYGDNIWQRSYHDHIIRGERDYQKIWEYIDTNALRWEEDCFYV
ncbi:MAG: hypothetical protein E7409_02320 [Ruminococcaceae bacterium]|nr:hypothetical protein [Oscillospiraceae bacterium]